MAKPIIAIVGRPNVGKSTLFNAIAGERISIVHDEPGITRDRIYADCEWFSRPFVLIDTGGIEPKKDDVILSAMFDQVEVALEIADVIVFIVDVKAGLTAADYDIANLLRKTDKPVIVTVNKCDHVGDMPMEAYEFYNLGFEHIVTISAEHRLGISETMDEVFNYLPQEKFLDETDERINVAIIGKPNAGKSSLINKMLKEERTIVSPIAGTTRDAIDAVLDNEFGAYRLIDTAGLKKKSKLEDKVEKYSMIRSMNAIERADVCLIMIDANEGITALDMKIAGFAHNTGKASIIVVNKWDLLTKDNDTMKNFEKDLREKFNFMSYVPLAFISAKTGQRVQQLFERINQVYQEAIKEIGTGVINEVIGEAIAMVPTPQDKGRHLKIYYATQVAQKPPQFVFFVNDPTLMHFSYERYLENQFRKNFGFEGTPIRFYLRGRKDKEKDQ